LRASHVWSCGAKAWEELPIAVRAFVDFLPAPIFEKPIDIGPWPFYLVLDCETLTDQSQRMRFGTYLWFQGDRVSERGLFYDPTVLTLGEIKTLHDFAKRHGYEVCTRDEFVEEILLGMAYALGARIIGFNLPFDLSRLALDHKPAKGKMHGGFSYVLAGSKWTPRVRSKHISRRLSFTDFAATYRGRTTRPMRKQKKKPSPPRRGYFVDIKTLGGALLAGNFSLDSLAKALGLEVGKLKTEEHGRRLTPEYLTYAMRDVEVTAECFWRLKQRFEQLGLETITLETAHSEASVGKAHFRQMGIKPWLEVQPDFPKHLIGIAMSTFFGGRSEVHYRREICRVAYCDFLSMYPSVFALMGLFKWVTSRGVNWRDATAETASFLNTVTVESLLDKQTWPALTTLVRVQMSDDIFPLRASYDEDPSCEGDNNTIGLNRAKSDEPVWYTLADCVVSTILNHRAPKVIEAIRFSPKAMQDGLKPIRILKSDAYLIDPRTDDFFKRLIEYRAETKDRADIADEPIRSQLEIEQNFLKILANSTGYGILAQFIAETLPQKALARCYGASGEGFPVLTKKKERPGEFFHPLLATFITGAARLMLALAERLSTDIGLDWALCDTDSMAFMKPSNIAEDEFQGRVQSIVDRFARLNPYDFGGSLLKSEKENYVSTPDGPILHPLYALPISAKRYALFNVDDQNRPIIRKASTHGVGQYVSPYDEKHAPDWIPAPRHKLKDVERWEHDLWYLIVQAQLKGNLDKVNFSSLPGFKKPAACQYTATSPDRLDWFERFNALLPPEKRVRPGNFLLSFQARPQAATTPVRIVLRDVNSTHGHKKKPKPIRPMSPYDRDPAKAAKQAFDRETGEPVKVADLVTYAEVLRDYARHAEAKFLNGGAYDRGRTDRRLIRVRPENIRHIGKESNELDEDFVPSPDGNAVTDWGSEPRHARAEREQLTKAVSNFGLDTLAAEAGITRQTLSAIVHRREVAKPVTGRKLERAITILTADQELDSDAILSAVNAMIEGKIITLRALARRTKRDASNISKTLSGKRRPSKNLLRALFAVLSSM
jgi:hypothetical protein